jgi:hypothetical protein
MIYLAGTFAYLKQRSVGSQTLYRIYPKDTASHSGIETSQSMLLLGVSFSFINDNVFFFSRTNNAKSFGYRSEEPK